MTHASIEERLRHYKQVARDAELETAKLGARIEELGKRKAELIESIKAKGIDPNNLSAVIEERRQQLSSLVSQIEGHELVAEEVNTAA